MYITPEMREKAKEHIDDLLGILFQHFIDAGMALNGTWDRSDDGFNAMFDSGKELLEKIGVDVEDVRRNEIDEELYDIDLVACPTCGCDVRLYRKLADEKDKYGVAISVMWARCPHCKDLETSVFYNDEDPVSHAEALKVIERDWNEKQRKKLMDGFDNCARCGREPVMKFDEGEPKPGLTDVHVTCVNGCCSTSMFVYEEGDGVKFGTARAQMQDDWNTEQRLLVQKEEKKVGEGSDQADNAEQ